jgi:hypothetical protein
VSRAIHTQEALESTRRRALALGYVYGRSDALQAHIYGEAGTFADYYEKHFEGDHVDLLSAYTQFTEWRAKL